MNSEINPCTTCQSPAIHVQDDVVNTIKCTKCIHRVVGQDYQQVLNSWNDGIKEDYIAICRNANNIGHQ